MTPLQKRIYTYMVRFKKKHGYSASKLVIAKALGKTKGDIAQVFRALKRKGYIVRNVKIPVGQYDPVDSALIKSK